MSTHKLTLYILSHDRPTMLKRCLESIKQQIDHNTIVIVSDNSAVRKKQVGQVVSQFSGMQFRNSLAKSGIEHINEVLKKGKGWFAILHDDDFLTSDFVREQLSLCQNGYSAITCRQKILVKGKYIETLGLSNKLKRVEVEDLNRSYFSIIKRPTSPAFPSYIYNSDLINGLYLNPSLGGKHCDVSFIMQVSKRGNGILYNPNALYVTEYHNNSDSSAESLGDKLLLIRWIIKNQGLRPRYLGYILHSILRSIVLGVKK